MLGLIIFVPVVLLFIALGVHGARLASRKLHSKTARYIVTGLCVAPAAIMVGLPILGILSFLWPTVAPSFWHLHRVLPEVELAKISALQSDLSVWTDGDLFIGFVAKADVVDDIVKRHGLKRYSDFPIDGEKPDWWSRNACSASPNYWEPGGYKIYASGKMNYGSGDRRDDQRGWEGIMLLYCGEDGHVLIDARGPID